MNFKSVTINLLLTTLSGGVLLQTLEAQAASITFDPWNFSPPEVIRSGDNTDFGSYNSDVSARTLKAFADTKFKADPLSIDNEQYATARIALGNFFTVTPGPGEKNGDKVDGILSGRTTGLLLGRGQAVGNLTGSFEAFAEVRVDAGFASYAEDFVQSKSKLVLGDTREDVNQYFSVPGTLTIGQRYPFEMQLLVRVNKTGSYETVSNFGGPGRGFTVNVQATPEPLTMLASATAVGFGAFFKRQHSKNQKKS